MPTIEPFMTDVDTFVTIRIADNIVTVKHTETRVTTTRDIGMNPTWPTPTETNDLIADAVRECMDLAYLECTGDVIDREPKRKGRAWDWETGAALDECVMWEFGNTCGGPRVAVAPDGVALCEYHFNLAQ